MSDLCKKINLNLHKIKLEWWCWHPKLIIRVDRKHVQILHRSLPPDISYGSTQDSVKAGEVNSDCPVVNLVNFILGYVNPFVSNGTYLE